MPATAAAFHETKPRGTALNVSLWTAQLVLFAMFALAGVQKVISYGTSPKRYARFAIV